MPCFDKYPHQTNFAYAEALRNGILQIAGKPFALRAASLDQDVYRLRIDNPEVWPTAPDRATPLRPAGAGRQAPSRTRIDLSRTAGLQWTSDADGDLLEGETGGWFGVSGRRWLFRFRHRPGMQFYGLGEKHTPFERSGRAYWFWNTDAWADHPIEHVREGDYDPDYIAVPYLVIRRQATWIGLLVDTAFPVWISLGGHAAVAGAFGVSREAAPELVLGAVDGPPALVLLYGPTLAALTRRFQMLIGSAPLPPLWSLGYHQSRWGYRGAADLERLADRFARHRFPVDGLWLDIDYMDGRRTFTTDARHLPDPAAAVASLKQRGYRVVPILDPGIKREAGDAVYESGRAADIFCRNTAGGLFTGLVWPGRTVFPDFLRPEARRWWADLARGFFGYGFEGAWLDMNDPSTGSVDCRDMRFDRGRLPHEAGHNDYALLMARATRDGLLAAHPDRRPFLLSRSGSTGSQRCCAHWTGDNFSSYGHLHRGIGKTLNLALSGMAFCGADVGGFGGDCTEALLVDWFKAAFLMPFFRNHTMRGSRAQEPWAFSRRALATIRRFVRLRYTFMPYLYNLFIDHEERGEAVLRPLFYDFETTAALPLGGVDDQFMVGPALMQAPFVEDEKGWREVVLPHARWLRADGGRWLAGGKSLRVRRRPEATPLFIRDGSLVPLQPGKRTSNRTDLNRIDLLCALSPAFAGEARLTYCADDGIGFDYRRGGRTRLHLAARVAGRRLTVTVDTISRGFGPVAVVPVTLNRFSRMDLVTDGRRKVLRPLKERMQLTGKPFCWYRWRG